MKKLCTSHMTLMFFTLLAQNLEWPDQEDMLNKLIHLDILTNLYVCYDFDGEDYYLILYTDTWTIAGVYLSDSNKKRFDFFIKYLKIPF